MSYYHEFRNFDFDIPHVEGFIDTSWHNDVSPKLERKLNETQTVTFWIDYTEEGKRECGGLQFTVLITLTEDDCESVYNEPIEVIETDSWDEAINAINQLFKDKSCTI
jgi:hypothetical protein